MTNSRTFYCNGCFASQHESPLIALPGHIFLCSDCVDIAHETLHEKIKGEFDGQQPDEAWSDDADSDSAAVAEAIRAREEAIAQVSGLQLQVAGLVEALERSVAGFVALSGMASLDSGARNYARQKAIELNASLAPYRRGGKE